MWNFRSQKLSQLLRKYPGYKTVGEFAFLPVFFVGGAALEFVMINWHFGEVNFYNTFKRRQAKEQAEAIVNAYLAKKNQDKTLSSCLIGSQLVHNYYQPLADMDILIHKEVERLKAEKGIVDDSLK